MPSPTFIAAYSSAYNDNATPKTVSVTTQAGDIIVVYAGSENGLDTFNNPSGNSISFTLEQNIHVNTSWADAAIWSGLDTSGGTNWTLSLSRASSSIWWGFTCLVFRDSAGTGASTQTYTTASGSASVNLTTIQANSAVVVLSADWNIDSGSTRTWKTVNGITPSSGNGMETSFTSNANYIALGAYYSDVGSIGSKTVGYDTGMSQKYSMVALEVKGASSAPIVTTGSITNITRTTAFATGSVDSDGGSSITERGICWSTSINPTTSDSKAIAAGTSGALAAPLGGLTPTTTYHVRAYAINSIGTAYGSDTSFQTTSPTIADISWLGT